MAIIICYAVINFCFAVSDDPAPTEAARNRAADATADALPCQKSAARQRAFAGLSEPEPRRCAAPAGVQCPAMPAAPPRRQSGDRAALAASAAAAVASARVALPHAHPVRSTARLSRLAVPSAQNRAPRGSAHQRQVPRRESDMSPAVAPVVLAAATVALGKAKVPLPS